jgi:hypothetical protein
MKTKYNEYISDKLTIEYLKWLIDKIYSLLCSFEESISDYKKYSDFLLYQDTLIRKINGHTNLVRYNNILVYDLLSNLESLKLTNMHDEYRRHIFKITNIIDKLIKEVGDAFDGV